MKRTQPNLSFLILAFAIIALVSTTIAAQNDRQAEAALQRALNKEFIDGDIERAIKQYREIVSKYRGSAIAAKALLHLGEAYERLGSTEAQQSYERIMQEFGNQKDVVAEARIRLASLRPPATSTAGIRLREFTVTRSWGDVSANGRYAWNGSLHTIATGTDQPFDLNGKDGASEGVRFSRDEKQLAYVYFNRSDLLDVHYELRLIKLQSPGKPEVITRFGSDINYLELHDWTPDGKWVVISLIRGNKSAQVGMVSVTDGALRILKDVEWRGPWRMFVSPDGRNLAYALPASESSRQYDVFVRALDSTHEEPLVTGPTHDVARGWSPDGRYLLFSSEQDSGEVNLYALAFRDGKAQGGAKLVKPNWGPITDILGMTASGSLYYNVPGPSDRSLRIAEIDLVRGIIGLSGSPINGTSMNGLPNSRPVFSHDGKYLAYSTAPNSLTIRALETGQVVGILRPALNAFDRTQWSPDGHSFLVSGTDFKGRNGIYLIDAQTREVSRPVGDCELCSRQAAWSSDSKSIYYLRPGSRPREGSLTVRDLESGKEREVLKLPRQTLNDPFGLSPDGRYIAFSSGTVSVMPVTGGEPRNLTRGRFLAWTPDSQSVIVAASVGGSAALSVVSLGGEVRTINGLSGADFVVSPDGRHLAITLQDGPAPEVRIGVLENFLSALNAHN